MLQCIGSLAIDAYDVKFELNGIVYRLGLTIWIAVATLTVMRHDQTVHQLCIVKEMEIGCILSLTL